MADRCEATREGGAPAVERELVLLVHGFLRTPRSMAPLARALAARGFEPRRFAYRSWRGSIDRHAAALRREVERLAGEPGVAVIHVVGHSLGNILARAAIGEASPARLGRVAMLAPPNAGSPVARWLARPIGRLVPILRELSDGPEGRVRALPTLPGVDVLVVAARYDHLVSEPASHLQGERAHRLLATTHTTILLNRDAHRLVAEFLRSGSCEARGSIG